MSINLSKGQKIDLGKTSPGLDEIEVGLGWDEAKSSPVKGFFGKMKSKIVEDIDCDASVLMLNGNDKLQSKTDLIYFGNLKSKCGGVIHTGDNLTGSSKGDDEVINVSLSKLGNHVEKVLFVVNIYQALSRNQHFGMVENAYIRVSDKKTGEELVKFDLTEDYDGFINLFVGELVKENDSWSFKALGDGGNHPGLGEITKHYMN